MFLFSCLFSAATLITSEVLMGQMGHSSAPVNDTVSSVVSHCGVFVGNGLLSPFLP